jgi:hypothetical protein
VPKFEEFARVRMVACRQCGRPLIFCAQFKKFGEHRVEICEFDKLQWHNDDPPRPIEVGE